MLPDGARELAHRHREVRALRAVVSSADGSTFRLRPCSGAAWSRVQLNDLDEQCSTVAPSGVACAGVQPACARPCPLCVAPLALTDVLCVACRATAGMAQ